MDFKLFLIIILLLTDVITTGILIYFILNRRKALARRLAELETAKDEALKQQADELEKQKFKMAEANLKMLEQSEILEEQKFRIADSNIKLLELNELINEEKRKSEQLLLNVLPPKVAEELKSCGKTEPESFENVTVYFSDIVGFTDKASSLEPKELIGELNHIFTAFDRIIKKNNCERIKTIGDAYLCVCGMPESNPCHAENIVNSAIEIIEYLKERNRVSPIKWELRVGIHSGKVVGGVVGVEKYIYDVFGDTINTASRMESSSEPMQINVSETTYLLVKEKFRFTDRGEFEVKGKGFLKMYFLDGRIS